MRCGQCWPRTICGFTSEWFCCNCCWKTFMKKWCGGVHWVKMWGEQVNWCWVKRRRQKPKSWAWTARVIDIATSERLQNQFESLRQWTLHIASLGPNKIIYEEDVGWLQWYLRMFLWTAANSQLYRLITLWSWKGPLIRKPFNNNNEKTRIAPSLSLDIRLTSLHCN